MKQLFLAIALMWASVAQASIIEISTEQVDVTTGDEVSFTINLVDFEEFDFLTFSLDFDETLLSFDASSLSSDFAIVDLSTTFDGLDVSEFAGSLFFSLTSDLFDGETFVGSSMLATFNFSAIGTGAANFTPLFDDIDSLSLDIIALDAPTFLVASDPTAVAAPATIGMFAGLMLALVAIRRRSINAN
jgi:hypothetical protein